MAQASADVRECELTPTSFQPNNMTFLTSRRMFTGGRSRKGFLIWTSYFLDVRYGFN